MQLFHASCVAVDGNGLLILGASGAGKSALALQLMGLGAALVADDQTELRVVAGQLVASAPARLSGIIEARGVGLLRSPPVPFAPVRLVVDLSQHETERLPPSRKVAILGVACDLVHAAQAAHFPVALLCWLRNGRFA